MINTLYLPELREMLAADNSDELGEFCIALHPARTAEFMEGLSADETWLVLSYTDSQNRVQIFSYFSTEKQEEIITTQDRETVSLLVAEMAPDDRADLLQDLETHLLEDLLNRIPAEERRDYLRLSQYPEGTAGAVMTSEFAKLDANLTIEQAIHEIGRQSEEYETIYYLYVLDGEDHLLGLVSARQLLEGMRKPATKLLDIMETDLVTCAPLEDQEDVVDKVARMDLLAIPVVEDERKMLGIITHDDIIDVVQEEATEDAHQMGAVNPLDETYLRTSVLTLSWKRGIWLMILFFFALLTAFALELYDRNLTRWVWLVPFIPLVISSGGNSGSQSATLIITALSRGHISLQDWSQVIFRELLMGLLLGTGLGILGYCVAQFFPGVDSLQAALVVPVTLLLVVIAGTLTGSILPLLFERLGLDPAMMSNPFVAGIIDILGIVIYMNVAIWFLGVPPAN
ncbi:MAG: magnesium transporter [Mariniblastus sp.]|nr:magnesium transporter [Mariniblastus sp.]